MRVCLVKKMKRMKGGRVGGGKSVLSWGDS